MSSRDDLPSDAVDVFKDQIVLVFNLVLMQDSPEQFHYTEVE